MVDLTRRKLVGGIRLGLLASQWGWAAIARAQAAAVGQPLAGKALIVGRPVPLTAEAPLSGMTSCITPNDRFPILTSIASSYPVIEPAAWRLSVEGVVERPAALSYAEHRALPSQSVTAIVECAGNSRNFASPPLPRSVLSNGYVGNAEWRGAPLRLVLERAGVKAATRAVVLEGADP